MDFKSRDDGLQNLDLTVRFNKNGIPAPPGVDENDTSNMGGTVLACAIVSVVISGLALAARFYARGHLKKLLGLEDWCCLVAWMFALGYTISTSLESQEGVAHHLWTLSPEHLMNNARDSWVSILMYQISIWASKCAMLFLYIRVFKYQATAWAAYILLFIVIVYNLWAFVGIITQCIPLRAYWDPHVPGLCHGIEWLWASALLHCITDGLIFAIPLPVLLRMRLPYVTFRSCFYVFKIVSRAESRWRQKLWLILILLLGFFVCAISIVRVVHMLEILDSEDFTWDFMSIANWTTVEVNTAILVSCLIVMRPLFAKFWPSLIGPVPEGMVAEALRLPTDGTRASNPHEVSQSGTHKSCSTSSTPHRAEEANSPRDSLSVEDLEAQLRRDMVATLQYVRVTSDKPVA